MYSLGKIRGFLHLYIGEEAVAVGAMQALGPKTRWSRPTASMAMRLPAAFRRRGHGRDVRQGQRQPAAAAADRCTCLMPVAGSTADTRSSAADCRSRSGWPWPTRCGRGRSVTACFFGDGAVVEGEFHEVAEPRGAVGAAGAVPLREQPLRDGHGARASHARGRLFAKAGQPATACGRHGRRHGCARRRAGGHSGRRRSVRGGRAGVRRAAHLPVPRPFHVRPRPVPHQGRDRASGSAATRSRCHVDRLREAGLLADADRRGSRPKSPPRSPTPSRSPRRGGGSRWKI